MDNIFGNILNILDGDEWEEKPVEIEEFVQSEEYLNLPPLSDNQYKVIKASSQIYKRDTLIRLYGERRGNIRWKQTYNEVILQCGKGSGKDYISGISCAYIVHLLLCLKDPAGYYGKPPGNAIDIMNIAVNAVQAEGTFFKNFKNIIEKAPWFIGKYSLSAGKMAFDKNVTLYSGHSEREAWEGFNPIYVVLDEISAFQLESSTGNSAAKTAQAIYDMHSASVASRFADFGKLVLLSFPRFKDDFIQQRYDDVVATKDIIIREHTFKLDEELPDGSPGNELTIEWEEDQIISYKYPKVFALKRPTWEMNPLVKLDSLAPRFFQNPVQYLARFACMPPMAVDAFFKDKQKIEAAFSTTNGVEDDGSFRQSFLPDPEKTYFIHVDLARVHDHAAVALAHVEKWETRSYGARFTEPAPVVIIDCVRYWTPTPNKDVDFTEIREFILSLRRRGFKIGIVTFDRWESDDTMKYLRAQGMESERLSVAKKHYDDFAMVVAEERVYGPQMELLITELLQLQLLKNDKVDHPRKGSKDVSDAVCGAIFNAVSRTPRQIGSVIETKTVASYQRLEPNVVDQMDRGIIKAPTRKGMQPELDDYMQRLRII